MNKTEFILELILAAVFAVIAIIMKNYFILGALFFTTIFIFIDYSISNRKNKR